MSKEIYKNRHKIKAKDIASTKSGELLIQDREKVRGKNIKEKHIFSFDAIFTFDDPLICEESEVPIGGGYFISEDGKAEVTQLIGRFKNEDERSNWLLTTFGVRDNNAT